MEIKTNEELLKELLCGKGEEAKKPEKTIEKRRSIKGATVKDVLQDILQRGKNARAS